MYRSDQIFERGGKNLTFVAIAEVKRRLKALVPTSNTVQGSLLRKFHNRLHITWGSG